MIPTAIGGEHAEISTEGAKSGNPPARQGGKKE